MFIMKGKYNIAKVFLDECDIDETTKNQIQTFLNHPAFAETNIAVMPDCHAGKGAVVGFTMTMNDYVIPNIVGVDINCGVFSYNLGTREIDLKELDDFVTNNIPSGFKVYNHKDPIKWVIDRMAELLGTNRLFASYISNIAKKINPDKKKYNYFLNSLGTLGGGNHFIELGRDDIMLNYYLTIHSGSRNFGLQIANYHQKKAVELSKKFFKEEKDLAFLPMECGGKEYLEDMKIAQKYASLNRKIMMQRIIEGFFKIEYNEFNTIESVHNYIDLENNIIRKGAISAQKDELVIIPFNMRDGMMIGKGKGNKDWNCSAPHGAGRSMSRTQAKEKLSMEYFMKSMEGIYTTSATIDTLDEAPGAYKNMDMILRHIGDTVEPITFVKSLWNFKAKGDKYEIKKTK